MTSNYKGEEIPTDIRGRALPARWNFKNRGWDILTVEETSYESNFTYCETLEVDTVEKPLSESYRKIREVLIQANPDNDHDLLIGNNSSQIMVLKPGRQMTIPVDNLDKLYVKSKGTGNNKLNYFARANLLLHYPQNQMDRFSINTSFGLRIKDDGSIDGWGQVNPISSTKEEYINEMNPTNEEIDSFPSYYFIPEGNDFIHVSLFGDTACALREDGSLECWGENDSYNQISDKPMDDDFVKVVAGDKFYIALKEDGSIVSWGLDEYGVVSDTPIDNSFVDIKTTYNSAFALRENGTLVAWGEKIGTVDHIPLYGGIISFYPSEFDYGLCVRDDGHIYSWFKKQVIDYVADTLSFIPRTSNWKKVYSVIDGGAGFAINEQDKLAIWGWSDENGDQSYRYIYENFKFKKIISGSNISDSSEERDCVVAISTDDKLIPLVGSMSDDIILDIPEDIYIKPEKLYSKSGEEIID